jgi:AraC family transcriptional regulator, regulatory protein of adaptative response / methylated-DNA-[protein]-cysteine methyltransferase
MTRTLTKRTAAKAELDDDRRWAAVLAHDKSRDGEFYYSVATTGVYCLPSCPARRPNRQNVRFHASCMEAEALGFRPCKRCRPNDQSLGKHHAKLVADACRRIEAAEDEPTLGALAEDSGLSRFHFHRIFKAVAGVTPKDYALAHRQKRIHRELERSSTVTEAIYDAGFNSSARFYAGADGVLGMSPTVFRSGGKNATLRFAVGECSLGSVLVAASEKGISAILLGDDPAQLTRDLQDRFPKAELIGQDRDFEKIVALVVGMVEAPGTGLDLPLDIRGTVFQHRVWQALRKIPPGSTATYAEIAQRIGAPRAVRAVARACAMNAHAIAIPCHRVVRTDGSLSGYRWGVARKSALLKREAETSGARLNRKAKGQRA